MCGIAGIAGENAMAFEQTVQSMTGALRHRGPDDTGLYRNANAVFGHRRLRVIDLEGGRQPMSNEDGSVWIVFNGEIYNFLELRDKLLKKGHTFVSRSDTEVIVHLYEDDPDFVKKLDGMFAFAIWDENKRKLCLARDRIGKKPLYYALHGENILFASELKAFFHCPEISKDWDLEALHHFLSLNYVPGAMTLLRCVRKIKPGHMLTFKDGKLDETCYWQVPTVNSGEIKEEDDALDALNSHILAAVKKRLISDVPLGVFLSGGIDSSLVVAALSRLGVSGVKTFSIGFKEKAFDETREARIVANYFGTDHHEFILEPDLSSLLPKIIWHSDEPSGDSSCFPTYLLSQMARDKITVALSGDGGDEFFAGYNTYQADMLAHYYRMLPLFLRKHVLLPALQLIPAMNNPVEYRAKRFAQGGMLPPLRAHYFWNGATSEEMKFTLYSPALKNALKRCDTFQVFEPFEKAASFSNLLDLFMYVDQKTYLPGDILPKVDRMSMAHGLEVRSPLLDTAIMELAYNIPVKFKIKRGSKKYILKKLLASMMPESLFSKGKRGFSIPVHRWFRAELKTFLIDVLRSTSFQNLGFFDPGSVEALMKHHFDGRANHGNILWSLMSLGLWSEQASRHR